MISRVPKMCRVMCPRSARSVQFNLDKYKVAHPIHH